MNTREFVKLKADANYVPIKYAVIEVYGAGELWLKVIGHGMDTEANFEAYEESIKMATYSTQAVPPGLQGTMGAYSTSTIALVAEYHARGNHSGPYQVG